VHTCQNGNRKFVAVVQFIALKRVRTTSSICEKNVFF
jgi:hypothetical protein